MIVSLIGYRGVGKSAVARQLAALVGWNWQDADEALESRAGLTIAELFAQHGEPYFRDLEQAVLADLTRGTEPLVLAAGGGAVLRPENCQALRAAGPVVWLQAPVDTILKRVANDAFTAQRRPKLTTGGGAEEVQSLLAMRQPLYQATADHTVNTEGKLPEAVAAEIAVRLQLPPLPGGPC